VLDTGNSMTSK